jgi:hypothetical protein
MEEVSTIARIPHSLGASQCVIECELRLLRCRDCGVRMEPVPWARPGAQHTRDFEDVTPAGAAAGAP